MNLPLPSNYEFLYISNGSSASAATCYFLRECQINLNLVDLYPFKEQYISYFKFLQTYKESKNIVFSYLDFICMSSDAERFVHSLSKKPLLYIARDPIEKIQHALNHLENRSLKQDSEIKIRLIDNYTEFFPQKTFWGGTENPTFTIIHDTLTIENSHTIPEKLVCDSFLKILKDKISFIHCIEFNDLKPDRAFDTFCKLAEIFGFEKPKNKEIFTNRVNRNRGALITLPTTLYAHPDDLPNAFKEGEKEKYNLVSLDEKDGFNIIITLPHYLNDEQKGFADISDEIYPNLIIDDTRILIIIDKNELARLKKNAELFNTTKTYLKGYINALIDNANKIKASLISEEKILEYLRHNDEVRKNIKYILDNELNYIKTHYPEFIQKWKYYLEFEKMCAELDEGAK